MNKIPIPFSAKIIAQTVEWDFSGGSFEKFALVNPTLDSL